LVNPHPSPPTAPGGKVGHAIDRCITHGLVIPRVHNIVGGAPYNIMNSSYLIKSTETSCR